MWNDLFYFVWSLQPLLFLLDYRLHPCYAWSSWPPWLIETIKKQQQSRVFFFWLNFNVYADVYNRERARSRDKKHEFSLETKTWDFYMLVRKWEMLVASKVKWAAVKKKANRNTEVSIMFVRFIQLYNISFIKRVTRKFHVVVLQKQLQRNVQKSVFTCKVVFLC